MNETMSPVIPRRLLVAALSLLLLWLVIYFLREYKLIFQPLLIAVLLGYLILPVHHWLEQHGFPSLAAYVFILLMILGVLFGVGTMVYHSVNDFVARWDGYEKKLDKVLQNVLTYFEVQGADKTQLRDLKMFQEMGSQEQVLQTLQSVVGTFTNFFTGLAVTFVYLVFLMAEKVSLKRRLALAFGDTQSQHILTMADTINRAVTQYLAVKTFNGALAAVLSLVVLASFGVDFAVLWAILIFLFNYIPYLGSLVAVLLPIALSFLQLDLASAVVVAVVLAAIQQVIGTFLEPRMAGRRLDVSPLLIILSLSFWGLVWGVVGMILAVPLLVLVKTILENIDATRPLALMMSNN